MIIWNALTIAIKNAGLLSKWPYLMLFVNPRNTEWSKCYAKKVVLRDDTDKRGHKGEQVEQKLCSRACKPLIFPKAQTSFRHLSWVSLKVTFCYKNENELFQFFSACCFQWYVLLWDIFFPLCKLILTGFQVQGWLCFSNFTLPFHR